VILGHFLIILFVGMSISVT